MITSPIETKNDIALRLTSVSKRYPLASNFAKHTEDNLQEFWALKALSLEIGKGQILGIIGRNGAGKSTLLNIISGVVSPTQGSVFVEGRVLGLFNLGTGFQDELTGRENIFLNGSIMGASRKELEEKLNSVIDFSELGNFIDMPLGSYSQGMRLRLGFGILANLDFDILVIDEVLAVGDVLFQHKCLERLLHFKRQGKTLLISSQSLDLMERLADKVALLEHGNLLFYGDTPEGINRYHSLLNSEKFFVGPGEKNSAFIENTKKWAEDTSLWGKKLGTKEIVIEKVEFVNKFGLKSNCIRTKEPLKIKVFFNARDIVKDPHFGVAIFRGDGAYCYGPNTAFDGCSIKELKKGRGYFSLTLKKVLLAPGEYRISVAILDKNEVLAFDYHNGCYTLKIEGYENAAKEILNLPFRISPSNWFNLKRRTHCLPLLACLEPTGFTLESLKSFNGSNQESNVFLTNEKARFIVDFKFSEVSRKNHYFWFGIFRDDGVCCQSVTRPFRKNIFKITFPRLPLLPGKYKFSIGIWNSENKRFVACFKDVHAIQMRFSKQDHGTVYLVHKWQYSY
jgi:ABC-type polysaccharide/polyol phosphate transport system ATPase subunit